MKKYLIIFLSIFSIFFLYDNVNALTFEKCGENIEVNDSNFIYYLYKENKNYFDSYDYFYFYNNFNNYGYRLFFSNIDNFYASDINSSNVSNSSFAFKQAIRLKYSTSFIYQGLDNFLSSSSFQSAGYFNLDSFITNSSRFNVYISGNGNYVFNPNLSKQDLENYFTYCSQVYTITYYLNNEIYQTFTIESGSSHNLLYYEPSIDYEFSGWSYDSNIDLTNITSNVNIYGTTTLKPTYTISYYLNNELYDSISVLKGTNYTIQDYIPPRHYEFSGWSYDSNIDLTNITSNVVISGTIEYVRPNIEYTEETNSIIHNITLKIVGDGVPQEFDFIYTIFDLLVLLVLVITILSPFILLFKLLGVI